MVIIADSGSTKTSWSILIEDRPTLTFHTEGYNPYYVDSSYIQESIVGNFESGFSFESVKEIYFYGAGCSEEKSPVVNHALAQLFCDAKIFVQSDLVAAAKSVLGDENGFIAILGTGTNSGIFDGKHIVEQVDSLGFLLGDEGSGAYLGKKLLAQYARKALPADLMKKFKIAYEINPSNVVDAFFATDLQNRYSASFAKFLNDNIEHIFVQNLIRTAFDDFFGNIVSLYANYESFKFNCVGAIGFTFSNILEEVADKYGMKIGKIIKSPIGGLVEYHLAKMKSKR